MNSWAGEKILLSRCPCHCYFVLLFPFSLSLSACQPCCSHVSCSAGHWSALIPGEEEEESMKNYDSESSNDWWKSLNAEEEQKLFDEFENSSDEETRRKRKRKTIDEPFPTKLETPIKKCHQSMYDVNRLPYFNTVIIRIRLQLHF